MGFEEFFPVTCESSCSSRTKLTVWLTVVLHNDKGGFLVLRGLLYWVFLNGTLVAVRVDRVYSVWVTLTGGRMANAANK